MDRQAVEQAIRQAIREYNAQAPSEHRVADGPDAALFGRGGPLDSVALVNLVVQVEETIEEKFGASVILANEKAMSRSHSPFRTVRALTDYVAELLQEERAGE